MNMQGSVVRIFVCPNKGLLMQEVGFATAYPGVGLDGDRYALGIGAWSKARATIRQVSLISTECIDQANLRVDVPFIEADTRRNIITRGIDLNLLIGREFLVGPTTMRGVELCDPCARPSVLSGKKGFAEAFNGIGGLRAEIVTGGVIHFGDNIIVL